MLKLYHHPLSPLARRVWITLLEKNIPFESIIINLDGEQFKPDFLKLNPFHQVPVIIDNGLRILESLAIIDYLESKYPTPSLLPKNAEQLAKVRMVQMLSEHKLIPQLLPIIVEPKKSRRLIKSQRQLHRVLTIFAELLGEDNYFGGNCFSVGDIVGGNGVILINKLGISLDKYPNLLAWRDRLMLREIWQKTQPSDAEIVIFKQRMHALWEMQQSKRMFMRKI
ncbi:MAG: glutathione S-transferase family protein [Xenococcus sp. MO_188.B8]|nr:glutathione S-transferase family protein [Xenococcus sp. MO_188.B8]